MRCGGLVILLACMAAICMSRPGHAAPGTVLLPSPKATVGWWPAANMPDAGRAYHQMVSHNGALYLIGGITDGASYPVLRSTDGATWLAPAATEPLGGRFGHAAVSFNGKIWVLGGHDFSSTSVTNEVWSSEDGVDWTQAPSVPWAPRIGLAALVHAGQLWVLGGLVADIGGQKVDQDVNDVWSTSDGVSWNMVSSVSLWPSREFFGAVSLGEEMFVMGGFADAGTAVKGLSHLNDVWRSANGSEWTLVTEAAPWPGRSAPACAVYDGKIWVMGGQTESAANNDLWVGDYNTTTSTLAWQQPLEEAPWSPLAYAAATVHNSRLWASGGLTYEGLVLRDVWYYGEPIVAARYRLTVTQSAGGAVSAIPPSDGDGLYAEGTVVTLTATPDPGYLLSMWEQDLTGNYDLTVPLVMDSDKYVSAVFHQPPAYTLTILPTPGGTVTADPPETEGGYAAGTQVTLQATPDAGYRFVRWVGAVQGAGSPTALLTMDDNHDVGALFALPPPPGNWYDPWASCFAQCAADSPDGDGDGLTACQEACMGTRDDRMDTDGDGMPDGWEAFKRLNPVVADAGADPDQDSMTNLEEFLARSDPKDPNSPVRTFFVSPAGTDGLGYGGPGAPFQTLSFAVRAAAASEANRARVILFAGEYTADLLRLPRGLELRGREGDAVVVRGSLIGAGLCAVTNLTLRPAAAPTKSAGVPPLLTMLDAVIKVDGVAFDGGEVGLLTTGDAPARSLVESCTFTGMTVAGIRIFGAVPVIRRCLFANIPGDAVVLEPWEGDGADRCVLGDSADPNTGWNEFDVGTITGRVVVNRRGAELVLQNCEWGTDSPEDMRGAVDAGEGPEPVVEPFLAQGSAVLAASVFCSVVEAGSQVPVTNATVTLQGSP